MTPPAASLKAALKGYDPATAITAEALETAVVNAEAATVAAQASATAADLMKQAAIASGQDVKSARAVNANPSNTPATASTRSPASASGPAPAPTATTGPSARPIELSARARAALDAAANAATNVARAAKEARQAAAAAEKSKKGLGGDLLGQVSVPKYIADRTFVAVLVHVLTSDEALKSLADSSADPDDSPPQFASTSLWDRFGSALKVVGGVASRLPDTKEKAGVNQCISSIERSLKLVNNGANEAVAAVGQLEQGIDDLRASIAAVPDDSLRAALDREVDTSLRPLHALGQDVLTLQRAGQAVALMTKSSIKTALAAFLAEADEDLDAFKRNVGSWYNDVMTTPPAGTSGTRRRSSWGSRWSSAL